MRALLEKIGLTPAEGKLYLTLLELGSAPSGRIVKETELIKSTVYDTLRRLQEKGLVSYVFKEGVKHFEAMPPERLLDYIKDKKRKLDAVEIEARQALPKLKRGLGFIKPHAEAHVLAGVEGFKTMRRDVLKNARGEHLLIGAISRENEAMPAFFKDWNKERQKKKICICLAL